ncbi:2-amino-4-hydroxy-6-hydroxymethyldihydropteridine diphosphokinase [Streptohalobacillus salinus]|uniref:2-amino-4-hydroxy-6-hydroxymethyldihydropteridine diphosphokinase n=1 Tax=Streptohalobacillus salinus TaxID=621096 RepID=A0A2V3W402_9BACI|nr:2-amino-4-hydroxy-6-hydroxymethyldihydropteridine diphosphokinase [Streptohalobacillus salinus]PXW88436.1 2-amino-4-hydroxy-6-hydroxymethyldihydropteridine diphosphokinase [Streptohalobacillus salinus]
MEAYIALGSNIEPRVDYLAEAIKQLEADPQVKVIARSSIYETEPVGYTEQSKFLNQVIQIETDYMPEALLETTQAVEQMLGRKRAIRWGPRTIDLDILLFEEIVIDTEQLTVPHPRLQERAFVLVPLSELAPRAIIPGVDQTVEKALAAVPAQDRLDVKRLSIG